MWIFLSLLTPAFYAISELLDGFLSNKQFRNVTSLAFFASLTNLIFVPIVFFIEAPNLNNLQFILPLIGVGLTNILYLFPYYRALQIEDTSVVAAFFSFGKILTPLLAYFLLNEKLSKLQYLGIGLVIFANCFLAFKYVQNRIELKKSFILIVLASVILVFEGILFKYMFEKGLTWSGAVGGQLIASFIIGIIIFSLRKFRRQIQKETQIFLKNFKFFFVEEFITFSAISVEAYAIKLAPLSLVKGIGLAIPLFVVLFAFLFRKFGGGLFQENLELKILIKKIPLYFIIVIGLFLLGFSKY